MRIEILISIASWEESAKQSQTGYRSKIDSDIYRQVVCNTYFFFLPRLNLFHRQYKYNGLMTAFLVQIAESKVKELGTR